MVRVFILVWSLTTTMASGFKAEEDPMTKAYAECGSKIGCIEQHFNRALDSIKDMDIFGDGVLTLHTSEKISIDKPEAEEDVWSRVERFLKTSVARVKLQGKVAGAASRAFNNGNNVWDVHLMDPKVQDHSEGRGRLRKLLLPLILGMKLKFAILLPIFISVIALISFKGLWAGLAAMLVSAALGLKALIVPESGSGGHNSPSTKFSFGVIKPHHLFDYGWHHHHPHHHDPYWSRAAVASSGPDYPFRPAEPYRAYYAPWEHPAPSGPS